MSVALVDRGWPETVRVTAHRTTSVFAGFRFPPEVISVAVRWYLRYGLSYRDVEELLAERGITVDHVTIYRWVQRFTAEFIEAARPCRHAPGDRWFADETYVKVAGRWTYLYRAIDQHGQVIDVLLSQRRDLAAARRFFTRALHAGTIPAEVTTDRAPAYPRVLDELIPSALHTRRALCEQPGRSRSRTAEARLRPMRGLKLHRSRGPWLPGMPSSRTSAAATTNSPPTSPPATGSAQHSTSSRWPSDSPFILVSALCHAH
jgi:transposase, IS6 family